MKKQQSGFTLVELLVVIAIIGMLMALLLPAVQNARETGRRAVCLNNMKQMSIALRGYESAKKELPGYANRGVANRIVPWTVMLFPYIERNDVWSRWNDATVTPDQLAQSVPYMELLLCPSSPPVDQLHPWTSFVVNCGKRDVFPYRSVPPLPPTHAQYGAAEKTANGLFFNRYSKESIEIVPRPNPLVFSRLSMSLDHIPDGASNTMMVSENVQAWKYTDDDTGNSPDPSFYGQYSAPWYIEQVTGFVWDPLNTGKIINTNKNATVSTPQYVNSDAGYAYTRPSSNHPNGVNAGSAGGELYFQRDDIDPWVYQQLMTSDGKHSDMSTTTIPGSNPATTYHDYLLNDQDYK